MASSATSRSPLSPPTTAELIPSNTDEYSSGFSQHSFLSKDFDTTSFINKCAAKITEIVNNDFQQTLSLIDIANNEDMTDTKEESRETDMSDEVFPSQHLTVTNLRQLHSDLAQCSENIKRELIDLFESNYAQFLELNESLRSGTEENLEKCADSLNKIHKKYSNVYAQIFRLLERIYQKSQTKSNLRSKINKLKQIQFVECEMRNIRKSIHCINDDFEPFVNISNISNLKNEKFKNAFISQMSAAKERKQFRLLHKSAKLEKISLLLCKLSAIFETNELSQHLLISNKKTEFIHLRNVFFAQLKLAFCDAINTQNILALRSHLRSYNYIGLVAPEQIVRDTFINAAILKYLPLSLFEKRPKLSLKQRRLKINAHFSQFYDWLTESANICVLFKQSKEIMNGGANDFIGDSVWKELISVLFGNDYLELFVSLGLPDLFHTNYTALMAFFRKIQKLYFVNNECQSGDIDSDKYLYFSASSVQMRKKCNLSQYFLFRMPYITASVMALATNQYSQIQFHFKLYCAYFDKMRGTNNNESDSEIDETEMNEYIKRINTVNEALINSKMTEIYNYKLAIFQIAIINALQCWNANTVWIWELSHKFLKLTAQILSFLYEFLRRQMTEITNSQILALLHSDLVHFCDWLKCEFIPFIEYEFTSFVCNETLKTNIISLIHQTLNICCENLTNLRENLWNNLLISSIVKESILPLIEVDELAHSWQANLTFETDKSGNENETNETDLFGSNQNKISKYVCALFKPLQTLLLFANNHSLEHISVSAKNALIWTVLNELCFEYWNKIATVQQRLAEIRRVMEQRRRRRFKNKSESDLKKGMNKTGAEKTEYKLFCDVRQFRQQIQGFVNGINSDESKERIRAKQELEREQKERESEKRKKKSAIVVIKKKKSKAVIEAEETESDNKYAIHKLKCWADLNKFVAQFQ